MSIPLFVLLNLVTFGIAGLAVWCIYHYGYLRQPKRNCLLLVLLAMVAVVAILAILHSHLTVLQKVVFIPLVPISWYAAFKHRNDERPTVSALVFAVYCVTIWLLSK